MSVRIVLNSKGVKEMLHAPGVDADLKRRAEKVQAAASAGMEDPEGMEVRQGDDVNRARYVVVTVSAEAKRGEALDRRLTAAIDFARG